MKPCLRGFGPERERLPALMIPFGPQEFLPVCRLIAGMFVQA